MKRAMCISLANLSESLKIMEMPEPMAGPGQVLISMLAAPINPADLLLLTGRHVFRPELPAPIGIEGVGVVAGLGEGVTTLSLGDRVVLPFGNTWAERLIMRAEDVVKVPASLDVLQAAMLSVNPVTAAGLLEGLQAGDWLVQNAANSAVGSMVIRLARRRGIRTVNVVRREALASELLERGADVVLVGDHDLPNRIAEATQGARIRRGLDAIAGEAAGRLLETIADGGTLICYGLLADDRIILPATRVIFRDVHIRGYSRLRWLNTLSFEAKTAVYSELCQLLEGGLIRSDVEAVYPFEQVQEAVNHAAREGRSGKVLLQMSSPA